MILDDVQKEYMKQYAKDRDAALIEAVTNDNWGAFIEFCNKYNKAYPADERVMKGAAYKMVSVCINIPQKVKIQASSKCLALGFYPYID